MTDNSSMSKYYHFLHELLSYSTVIAIPLATVATLLVILAHHTYTAMVAHSRHMVGCAAHLNMVVGHGLSTS